MTELESNYQEPVICVGHSLGGVLTFLAAATRPDLISQAIMLDAPIINGKWSYVLSFVKHSGLAKKRPPASRTLHRRNHWDN